MNKLVIIAIMFFVLVSCVKKTIPGDDLMTLIESQENISQKDSLYQLYTQLFTEYPEHPKAAEFLYKTADYHAKNNEIQTAAIQFRKYFETYADSSEAANSLFKAAFLYEQIDAGISVDLYKKFLNTYPEDERCADVRANLPFVGKPAEYIMEQLIKQGKLQQDIEDSES